MHEHANLELLNLLMEKINREIKLHNERLFAESGGRRPKGGKGLHHSRKPDQEFEEELLAFQPAHENTPHLLAGSCSPSERLNLCESDKKSNAFIIKHWNKSVLVPFHQPSKKMAFLANYCNSFINPVTPTAFKNSNIMKYRIALRRREVVSDD